MTLSMRPLAPLALVLLTLVGCDKSGPVDDTAPQAPAATENVATPVAGGPPSQDVAPQDDGLVPVALRGRWGLTPADCEAGRSDAKGLLTISADDLKFYESKAVPATSIEKDSTGISGNWDFSGEGQHWSKYVSLKLNGTTLTRTERAPMASYEYAKCD